MSSSSSSCKTRGYCCVVLKRNMLGTPSCHGIIKTPQLMTSSSSNHFHHHLHPPHRHLHHHTSGLYLQNLTSTTLKNLRMQSIACWVSLRNEIPQTLVRLTTHRRRLFVTVDVWKAMPAFVLRLFWIVGVVA